MANIADIIVCNISPTNNTMNLLILINNEEKSILCRLLFLLILLFN